MSIVGKGATVLALRAYINVTTKPNASVSFIKGGTTVATKTADGSGNTSLEVLAYNWGEWTVSVSWTQSGISTAATGSASVTISEPTSYAVTVGLTWYLIKNGNFCAGFGHKYVATGGARNAFGDYGDYIWLTTDTASQMSNTYISGYFTDAIDMDYWNSLIIDCQGIGSSTYGGVVTATSAGEASFTNSVKISGQTKSYTSRSTKTVGLSGVSGTRYVALRASAWSYWDSGGTTGSYGGIRIYNLYLQR